MPAGTKQIGRRLRMMREAYGLSRLAVCRWTGIPSATWQRAETGVDLIGIDHALSLQRVFGVSLDLIYLASDRPGRCARLPRRRRAKAHRGVLLPWLVTLRAAFPPHWRMIRCWRGRRVVGFRVQIGDASNEGQRDRLAVFQIDGSADGGRRFVHRTATARLLR